MYNVEDNLPYLHMSFLKEDQSKEGENLERLIGVIRTQADSIVPGYEPKELVPKRDHHEPPLNWQSMTQLLHEIVSKIKEGALHVKQEENTDEPPEEGISGPIQPATDFLTQRFIPPVLGFIAGRILIGGGEHNRPSLFYLQGIEINEVWHTNLPKESPQEFIFAKVNLPLATKACIVQLPHGRDSAYTEEAVLIKVRYI